MQNGDVSVAVSQGLVAWMSVAKVVPLGFGSGFREVDRRVAAVLVGAAFNAVYGEVG